MIDESIRVRMPRHLRAIAGMSAAAERLNEFADYLAGTADTRATGIQMCTFRNPSTGVYASTCATVMRAALREMGVTDARIAGSYLPRVGMAFTDLREYARERGALTTMTRGVNPLSIARNGDLVMVNGDRSDGHVYGVTSMQSDGCESVDGGHEIAPGDADAGAHSENVGKQCIRARRKRWSQGVFGVWYDRADDGGPLRMITHILDVAKMVDG